MAVHASCAVMEPVNLSQTIGAAEADMRVEELAKWDSTLSVVIIRGACASRFK